MTKMKTHSSYYDLTKDETSKLRQEAGEYVKELRLKVGLTQRELAQQLGLEYYTFISQLETGHGRVPPYLYCAYAKALETDAKELALTLLSKYDPWSHAAITVGKHPKGLGEEAHRKEHMIASGKRTDRAKASRAVKLNAK